MGCACLALWRELPLLCVCHAQKSAKRDRQASSLWMAQQKHSTLWNYRQLNAAWSHGPWGFLASPRRVVTIYFRDTGKESEIGESMSLLGPSHWHSKSLSAVSSSCWDTTSCRCVHLGNHCKCLIWKILFLSQNCFTTDHVNTDIHRTATQLWYCPNVGSTSRLSVSGTTNAIMTTSLELHFLHPKMLLSRKSVKQYCTKTISGSSDWSLYGCRSQWMDLGLAAMLTGMTRHLHHLLKACTLQYMLMF